MRISDWSSDVCSSDLAAQARARRAALGPRNLRGVETMPVILDAQDQQHRRVLDDDARTACGAMANDVGQRFLRAAEQQRLDVWLQALIIEGRYKADTQLGAGWEEGRGGKEWVSTGS